MKTLTTVLIALAAWILLLVPFAGCDSDGDDATDADADTDTDGDTDTELDCEGGRLDPATGLCWQDPVAVCDGFADCEAWYVYATEYCDDLELGGHDDWFLPGLQDFMNLLGDCDDPYEDTASHYCNSCTDSPACHSAFAGDQETYWTSTNYDDEGEYGWVVDFENGQMGISDGSSMNPPAESKHVRCVRSTL